MKKECQACGGSGRDLADAGRDPGGPQMMRLVKCQECDGTGEVDGPDAPLTEDGVRYIVREELAKLAQKAALG